MLAFLAAGIAGCSGSASRASGSRQVHYYGWAAYVPQSVFDRFEEETGIRVYVSNFSSNEEMTMKLQSGVAEFDLVNPSDYMIPVLRSRNLLQKLDHSRLPNLKNIGERFRNSLLDPGLQYSAPFLWTVTGIGYNRTKVQQPVDSWGILWDSRYKNRILMLDDPWECFASTLKMKGYSINTRKSEELSLARDLLIAQKPLVKMYNSDNFEDLLVSGDAWIAHAWNGQMAVAIKNDPNLAFVVPKEGGFLSADHLIIPNDAPHPAEAYELMNYLLNARTGAEITNHNLYPNTNEAAKAFIRPEILNNGVTYPDEAVLNRCEPALHEMAEIGQLRDRYWTEIKSR